MDKDRNLKIFLKTSILLVYMHGPKILPMPKKWKPFFVIFLAL